MTTNKPDHVHKRPDACVCSTRALEPDDTCPRHGAGEWPPRCAQCGKFMKWEPEEALYAPYGPLSDEF